MESEGLRGESGRRIALQEGAYGEGEGDEGGIGSEPVA